jgi:hypothetical protein
MRKTDVNNARAIARAGRDVTALQPTLSKPGLIARFPFFLQHETLRATRSVAVSVASRFQQKSVGFLVLRNQSLR